MVYGGFSDINGDISTSVLAITWSSSHNFLHVLLNKTYFGFPFHPSHRDSQQEDDGQSPDDANVV